MCGLQHHIVRILLCKELKQRHPSENNEDRAHAIISPNPNKYFRSLSFSVRDRMNSLSKTLYVTESFSVLLPYARPASVYTHTFATPAIAVQHHPNPNPGDVLEEFDTSTN